MNSFKQLTAQLAHQVDRKLLYVNEEADYYRLDLSAHERVALPRFPALKDSFFRVASRFAGTALAIYLGLFLLTNAPAYTKIAMAHLQNWTQAQEEVLSSAQAEDYFEATLPSEGGILPVLAEPTSYQNRVSIPSLGINAPIVEPVLGVEMLQASNWNEFDETMNESLLQGVVHYPGTAEAGEKGNFFLTGHSSNNFWESSPFNTVFALLPSIEVGADVYVTYGQENYHYVVTEMREVSPDDVSILAQGDMQKMTLMTCTPVGTSLKRLVVTAELVETL